jgi:hypothetical protein
MSLRVNDRAKMIATFRYIEVRLMEITAAWTPTTPEMEVKVMFGRHIWDFAQHADALGKRTFELRQPEHYTLAPSAEYKSWLEDVFAEKSTAGRLAALYEGILPGLETRYRAYLDAVDRLLDEPSVVIIERILGDLTRMRGDAKRVHAAANVPAAAPDSFRERDGAVRQVFA